MTTPQDVDALVRDQLPPLAGVSPMGRVAITRPTAEIASSRLGIGFETLDRWMFTPEPVYPHLARLGATWARVQTGWSRCETAEGRYDFEWLDSIVDSLAGAGVRTMFSVTFGNKLYMPDAPHESAVGYVPTYYERALPAWTAYVRALAARYRGRVTHWEVWNEPNIPQFWQPRPVSGADYAELVRVTAEAVRAEIPDATVIGGATSLVDPAFLVGALRAGLAGSIDAFSFHPYQMVPEHNLRNMRDLLRRLLDEHSPDRRIALYQGENGCPSQLSGHHDDWLGMYTMDQVVQAKWIARRFLADLELGFDKIFYFHAVDLMERPYRQAGDKVNAPVMMGLIHGGSYTPKVSFEVARRVCHLFDERTRRTELMCLFTERDPAAPQRATLMAAPHVATFERDGAPLFAYWLAEDPQQRAGHATIDAELWWDDRLAMPEPVLLDLLTGEVYAVERPPELTHTDWRTRGLRYRLPLTDYPLVLTDAAVVAGLGFERREP
ncbi:beta-galactosidase [Phytohabitans sp. ZYX-F-186]|uniref:Beta-galactosidase n=1 Tax=Phytohabitans maris TaxID=3071409 RepID=A0ABU0ZFE6_9ACTN|nr:beta-galactosidase [Phytohabitans sp. ZYX-F-186]MDQ7905776.1 beta-galactosidase [Phytohabitans sp. ZYX-F-186]